jgi:type IV pilus assembly protein PilV
MAPLLNQKGISMLEVLISVVILTVAILGMATLQSRGIRGNDLGNRTSQAVALAQEKLEELIDTSRDTTLATGTTNDANNPIDETGVSGGVFTRNWNVQNGPISDAQTVTVAVSWTDIMGQHNVSVDGVITGEGY